MLFALALVFLYSIVASIDFMPIETRIIWDFGQKLPGAEPFGRYHLRIIRGDKRGRQSKNGFWETSTLSNEISLYGRLAQW